ncbi:uncharacterized protein [Miscanthus floridulus]|uniref:uncharacterized protein n=1 Tax=Miscanthus floridulus TaxID=154761 RepID=UPI00345AD265
MTYRSWYQRSTTAISVVARICYAHLAAAQVGQFIKFDEILETSSSHDGHTSAGIVPIQELSCLHEKNAFDLKSLKKSPLPLRMVVFAMTMLCGISICSMCMKQLGSDGWSRIVKIEVAEQPCNKSTVPPSEVQFVYYPQPITYSREECKCNAVQFFAIISSQ